MKNLKTKKFWALGAALIALAPLASCSNEEAVTAPDPYVDPAPEGYATVNIVIPNMVVGSRADGTGDVFATDAEATISNEDLWLCAFSAGGAAETKMVKLSGSPVGHTSATDYKEYSSQVQLREGEYHMYVIANVNEYITTNKITENTTDESYLKEMLLNFSSLSTNKGISKTNLPMACDYLEIQRGPSATKSKVPDGKFTVKKNEDNTLWADMDLLCAKVRFTVLFDMNDNKFSAENFQSPATVDYTDNATGSNIRSKTYWDTDEDDDYDGAEPSDLQNNISLAMYKADLSTDTQGTLFSQYENLKADTPAANKPADFTAAGSTANWNNDTDKKRAWQGIVYLPENMSQKKTTIKLNPKDGANIGIKNNSGADIGIFTLDELERGNYYDVVAKLISPNTYYVNVSVYVRVKPWVYVPSAAVPW